MSRIWIEDGVRLNWAYSKHTDDKDHQKWKYFYSIKSMDLREDNKKWNDVYQSDPDKFRVQLV